MKEFKIESLESEAQKLDTTISEFSLFDEEWRGYIDSDNNYYRILAALVKLTEPKIIVELGAHTGASTMALLAFLDKGLLYSVDKENNWKFVLDRNDPRLTLLVGDSVSISEDIPNDIDLLFIDTDHTKEQVTKEWNSYKDKMSPSGIILLDDIYLNDGMKEFWESLSYTKIDLSAYHNTGFGLVLI